MCICLANVQTNSGLNKIKKITIFVYEVIYSLIYFHIIFAFINAFLSLHNLKKYDIFTLNAASIINELLKL